MINLVPQKNLYSPRTLSEQKRAVFSEIRHREPPTFNAENQCLSFKALFFNKEIKQKASEQEKIAQALGVEADYGKYPEQAKKINQALKITKEAGYVLPDKIICSEKPFKGVVAGGRFLKGTDKELENCKTDDEYAEAFLKSKKTILIRPEIPEETMKATKTDVEPIKFVTFHELGHLNHLMSCVMANNISGYTFAMQCVHDSYEGDYDLEKELGMYSMKNGHEFIANVFAKKLGGESISEEAENQYKFWTRGHLKPNFWKS